MRGALPIRPARPEKAILDMPEHEPNCCAEMNIQRRLYSLVCGAVLTLLTMPASADISWYSYFGGKKFAFSLSGEAVDALTPWNMNGEQDLPVSPKEIHRVARAWIDKLDISPKWKWHLEELSLVPIELEKDKWAWKAEFDYQVTEGGQTGQPIRMRVFVTMDGKLIQPTITDSKR
jgi:hypothetical protein